MKIHSQEDLYLGRKTFRAKKDTTDESELESSPLLPIVITWFVVEQWAKPDKHLKIKISGSSVSCQISELQDYNKSTEQSKQRHVISFTCMYMYCMYIPQHRYLLILCEAKCVWAVAKGWIMKIIRPIDYSL